MSSVIRNFIVSVAAMFSCAVTSSSAAEKTVQERYIERYAPVAVREMYRSGVPASITLAQGLLESGSGQSPLAVKGNNHFGIKCHNSWNGGKIYHDDDRQGECFRKYRTPEESFSDHSDFLRYRDRYKFLFDLKTTDYKGWAYGLKKAGYATDPAYPQKLLKLINDYELDKYDTMPRSWTGNGNSDSVKQKPDRDKSDKLKHYKDKNKDKDKVSGAAHHKERKHPKHGGDLDAIPQSPLQIEQAVPLEKEKYEVFRFSLSRQMYSQNGVPFVYSIEGETYESIARGYNLFLREILKYNDLSSPQALLPGTVVYLQPKKKQAAKGLDRYVCEGRENPRDIAQRFAVRLSSLEKMNMLQYKTALKEGDVLELRKKK